MTRRPSLCGGFPLPLILLVLAGGTAAPRALPGQVTQRERQEAVAPALGIVEITPELRSRLGLFPGVEGFRAARLLVREDGVTVLEVESGTAGRVVRERRVLGPGELEAFQEELADRTVAAGRALVATREGRGGLVLGHTLLGLGYHGWAVPVALDLSSSRGAVAAYLLTAGASFLAPYALTRERSVTRAHRNLTLYGGTRGVVGGLFLGDLLISDDSPGNDSDRSRARFGGGVVLGWTGALLGFAAAQRAHPPEGTAALWSALGDAGLAGGAALALAAGPYTEVQRVVREGELTYTETRLRNRRLGHALTLAGHGAGLAAGAWLGERRDYSTGDATALRSAAVLGAQVGLTAARSASDDRQLLAGSALAAGVGGILAGDRLLRERSLEGGAGLLVAAGHVAGGATALGITYLATEDMGDRPVLFLTTSTLGSLFGAGLVWRAVAPPPGIREARSPGTRTEAPSLVLHPDGLLALLEWRGTRVEGPGGGPSGPRRDLPLVTFRF